MLVATAVLAGFLGALKAIGCPTIVIATIVALLGVDVLLIAVLLVADTAWYKRKADRRASQDDGRQEP